MNEHVPSNPSAPEEPNWQVLQTAFGSALVPLGLDMLCRASLAFGKLPFDSTVIARGEELSPTKPAGVVCGEKTGLLALGFAPEPAKHFLTVNPILSSTMVTRFKESLHVWLQPTNRLPPNTALEGIQVITDGIVPVHAKAEIADCSIFQVGKPLVLDLDSLIYPEGVRHFFVDWVVREKCGPPFIPVGRGRKPFNERYWAVAISKLTGLRYELSEKVFLVPDPQSQQDVVLGPAQVYDLVASMLKAGNLPAREFKPTRVKQVVEAIKVFCVFSEPTRAEAVMKFVQTRLEAREGGALNKNVAAVACRQFLQGRFKVSENKLRHEMSQAILKHFGATESHDKGRVFYGLALRFDGFGPNENRKPKDDAQAAT